MEYNSFTYFDENVYKATSWKIAVLQTFDEDVYKTTVWNIEVLHTLMTKYIKR